MPLPRGTDPDKAAIGYYAALQGFTIQAITHGIRRFLKGECEGVSQKFCPHPPELAAIIRQTVHTSPPAIGEGKKLYRYKPPRSAIREHGITKERAFNLIDIGVHPRGCIWCPGSLNDRPEIGDLFGPDPAWQPAVQLNGDAA